MQQGCGTQRLIEIHLQNGKCEKTSRFCAAAAGKLNQSFSSSFFF